MNLLQRALGRLETIRKDREYHYGTWAWKLYCDLKPAPPFEQISFEHLSANRPSDTIFILGSGPSLAHLTKAQWDHVASHASFGINYSFLMDFVPTYQIMEDPKEAFFRKTFADALARRSERFAASIWFMQEVLVKRLIHPRYSPEFFPKNPKVCIVKQPRRMVIASDRPMQPSDFETGLLFRGTKSAVLDWVVTMGFKNMVMLGVDLHTPDHFYDDLPEMAEYVAYLREREKGTVFDTMIPKPGVSWKHDDYLVALNEMFMRPRGLTLSMGFKDQVMYPRLPVYEWPGV